MGFYIFSGAWGLARFDNSGFPVWSTVSKDWKNFATKEDADTACEKIKLDSNDPTACEIGSFE